jgi:hypothetical protein
MAASGYFDEVAEALPKLGDEACPNVMYFSMR